MASAAAKAGTTCATPECQSWSSGRGFDLNGYQNHPYCELCQVKRGEREPSTPMEFREGFFAYLEGRRAEAPSLDKLSPSNRAAVKDWIASLEVAGRKRIEECISCGDTFDIAQAASAAFCANCGGAT